MKKSNPIALLHGAGKHQFGKRRKRRVIPTGGDNAEAGTDIVKAGDGGGKIGLQPERFPADKQEDGDDADDVQRKVGVAAADDGFVHLFVLKADNTGGTGVQYML